MTQGTAKRGPYTKTLVARQRLLTFLTEGATLEEACKRAGISPMTVKIHARNNPEFRRQIEATGWRPRPGRRRDTSWHQAVLDAITAGDSRRQAAQKAGIDSSLIRQHRDKDPEFAAKLAKALQAGKEARKARAASQQPAARELKPCGTSAAYARHLNKGEKPCKACRQARSEYLRTQPAFQISMKVTARARRQLAAAHPAEYQELIKQERKRTDRSPKSAYTRAALVLTRRHPDEYRMLVAAERDAIRQDREQERERKPVSRWRQGDRDAAALAAHNAELRRLRQRAVRKKFRPVERRLLAVLAAGTPVADAAVAMGLTVQALFNRARWDASWAARLDAALVKGRDPDIPHGTEYSYRVHRCRCPDCRAAKAKYR